METCRAAGALEVIQRLNPLAAVVTIGGSEAKRFWTDFL
jgi:hypothetical protein